MHAHVILIISGAIAGWWLCSVIALWILTHVWQRDFGHTFNMPIRACSFGPFSLVAVLIFLATRAVLGHGHHL